MQPENLLTLKDDMVAFITGHGLSRFPGFVPDDVASVLWEDENNPDSWKDFVEAAKAAGAAFLTISSIALEKEDLEALIEELQGDEFPAVESPLLEEAQYLVNCVGKTGFIQLGFAHQGVLFLHENSTPWFDRYEQLVETVEDFGELLLEGDDEDDDEAIK